MAQAALSDSDDSEAESDDAGVLELDVQSDDGSAAEERPESEESEESEASEAEESAASPAKTKLVCLSSFFFCAPRSPAVLFFRLRSLTVFACSVATDCQAHRLCRTELD